MLHRELSCGCWSRQARRLRPIHQGICPAPCPHSLCVGRACPALSAATSICWALTGSTVDSGNTEAIALRSARRGEHVRLPLIGTSEAARRWAAASTAAPRLAGSSPRLTVLTGPDHLLASHDAASLSLRPCSRHSCSKVGRGKEGGLSAGDGRRAGRRCFSPCWLGPSSDSSQSCTENCEHSCCGQSCKAAPTEAAPCLRRPGGTAAAPWRALCPQAPLWELDGEGV